MLDDLVGQKTVGFIERIKKFYAILFRKILEVVSSCLLVKVIFGYKNDSQARLHYAQFEIIFLIFVLKLSQSSESHFSFFKSFL
jgi:hypothetical protein